MRPQATLGVKLDREDVLRLAEEAKLANDELDLSGFDLSGINLQETELARVAFGRHHGGSPAVLAGASFRGSTLRDCFFAHADLVKADFRGCHITGADFRYATFRQTTLEGATLVLCDFYRACLEDGTRLTNAVLELVSLTASLDGATGLSRGTFTREGHPPALVAESAECYPAFLERTKSDRPESYSVDKGLEVRLEEAASIYRQLSGLWTSRAQFADAGWAYAHSRRLERQVAGPRGRNFRVLAWLWLWIADLLCGFGERLGRVVGWLLAVALIPGFAYLLFGGIAGAHGIADDLLFSVSQLTASTPARLSSSNSLVDWVRVVQTLAGVTLLGLFGFILGNKIRNS